MQDVDCTRYEFKINGATLLDDFIVYNDQYTLKDFINHDWSTGYMKIMANTLYCCMDNINI